MPAVTFVSHASPRARSHAAGTSALRSGTTSSSWDRSTSTIAVTKCCWCRSPRRTMRYSSGPREVTSPKLRVLDESRTVSEDGVVHGVPGKAQVFGHLGDAATVPADFEGRPASRAIGDLEPWGNMRGPTSV